MMEVVQQTDLKGAFLLLFFVLNAMTDVREKSYVTCSTLSWAIVHGQFFQLDFWDFIETTLINLKKKKKEKRRKRKIQSASRW